MAHNGKAWFRAFGLALVAVYAVMPLWLSRIKPAVYEAALGDTDETRLRRNESSVARLFGEFRAGMGDVMFVKTELYLHGGIAFTKPIDLDKLARTGEIAHEGGRGGQAAAESHEANERHGEQETSPTVHAGHEEEGEAGHSCGETLIPTPGKDWRGYIGALEREVKPWRDPKEGHTHGGGRELLPWYWLATRANPHNTKAYRVGVYWLRTIEEQPEHALAEAEKFADEGVRNNPDQFPLYLDRGIVQRRIGELLVERGDAEKGRAKLGEALESFREATRVGLRQRPPTGTVSAAWDEDREEDLQSSMRYTVYVLEQMGRYEEALKELASFKAAFPGDSTMPLVEKRLRERLETPPQ